MSTLVTVVRNEEAQVITLHGVVTLAERDSARGPSKAAPARKYHQQIITCCCVPPGPECKRIIGGAVREAGPTVKPGMDGVALMFSTGAMVEDLLLTCCVPAGVSIESG